VFVGGSAVATSLFPRYAPIVANPAGLAGDGARTRVGADANPAVASAMHRITGKYAVFGLIVPIAGIVLATVQDRLGEIWITTAIILTAIAGGLLAALIHPMQREVLGDPDDGRRLRTLSMLAGIYNLLWAVVVVLMIVRPGAR
jgi:drug/metabolite transporter (DMT)-like permease